MFSFFLDISMYDTILHVANDIITIWGALIIILAVLLMIVLLVMAARVNRVVWKINDTVSVVSQYVMLPFTYLSSLLSWSESGKASSSRKRTVKGKK